MKTLIYTLLFLISLPLALANPVCDPNFKGGIANPNYLKEKIIIPEEVKIDGIDAVTFVQKLTNKYLKDSFYTGKGFDNAIDLVEFSIKKNGSLSPVEKGEEMAKFAKELNPLFENMIERFPKKGDVTNPDLVAWRLRKDAIDEVKSIKFKLAKSVMELEEFAAAEFITVEKEAFVITKGDNLEKLTHMQMSQYYEYSDSLMHSLFKTNSGKEKLYENIDQGNLGVLQIGDIRDITSYNLWPMYLKRHDMNHIHYSTSHPMALGAMMKSTRSQNHTRYTMMAGLYEAVDYVQYSHETSLATFFGSKLVEKNFNGMTRNMDLEEGMLTIGLSTSEDLQKILTGAGTDVSSFSNQLQNWKPKKVAGTIFKGKALNRNISLDEEIDLMTKQFKVNVQKAENLRLKILEHPETVLSDADMMFMKVMSFQTNPEVPSISINGIQFKNDGRAHSRDADLGNTIGIGDQ